jgi:AraC-like DNA-binding protein
MVTDRYIVGLGVLLRTGRAARSGVTGRCFELLSARSGAFRLKAAGEARGALCTRAVIPPGAGYVIEGDHVELATTFVEADSALGRRARYETDAAAGRGSRSWIDVGRQLATPQLWTAIDAADWQRAIRVLHWALGREPLALHDAGPTARRAAEAVRAGMSGRVRVVALAGSLGLSVDQLTRALLAEVGLPARPFADWMRLHHYATLVAAGCAVDDAARATGFRGRAALIRELQRLVGFSERDVAAAERWLPVPDGRADELRTAI